MSALPDNRKIKPQQRLFFLLILLFGLPAHFLPLIRFFCFKHSHSLFHFSLLLITYFGALAQLGAHNTGSVGVRGSSPLCSTKTTKPPFSGGFSDIERIKDRASGFFLSSKQIPHPEAAFPSFSDVCMPLFRLWDRAICRQRQNHSRTVRSAFPQTNMRLL